MNKVLVVIDSQNDFIDGALGTAEARAAVSKIVDKIYAEGDKGTEIFTTQDTHYADYLNTQEGRSLPIEHTIDGTYGHELNSQIKTAVTKYGAKNFKKETFGSVELAQYLQAQNRENPIDEIELIGLDTDICVISNALLFKAFLPETIIKVDAACCAGVTPESHERALQSMEVCQIIVIR
ncbi:hypothetical protein MmiAt1_17590 [Methanimicrococcus sp. At1]|uniref:nicotinamidase n=1 Tax=Methanimicrococcus hacksteinii TaxID=3028293 RepID=A0ABU3VRW2_9EURY|nr:isochorismatase family cysteine hydrolase [Methanimicrococcus sp. At1]MDV0446142.1 hypothetical protein [Methanimicrococcus sp. At1]